MILTKQRKSLSQIKNQVARLLLGHAENRVNGRRQLTISDMADKLDADRNIVYLSLKSLVSEGLISFEQNRIVIKRALVESAAN